MIEVISTAPFDAWLASLRDRVARARILLRLERLAEGNQGDAKSLGDGLFELRVDTGPGYRIYFIRSGDRLCVLLGGGDKSSQRQDIGTAKRLAATWRSHHG